MMVVQDDGSGALRPIGACSLKAKPGARRVSVHFVGPSGIARRVWLDLERFVGRGGTEDIRVVMPPSLDPTMLPGWRAGCLPPAGTPAGTPHWLTRDGAAVPYWALWDGRAWRFGFGGVMRGTHVLVGRPRDPDRLAGTGLRYMGPAVTAGQAEPAVVLWVSDDADGAETSNSPAL